MLHRPWLLVLAAVTLATACSDDGNGQEPAAATAGDAAATVAVSDMRFSPDAVEIDAGEAVTWSFDDRMPHDVAFDDRPASPKLRTGTWGRTFEEPGTYDYICTLHPNMTGTVTVG
jgi:plastocyanin